MKSLADFIQEEAVTATPGNTMGMDNPVADDGTEKGTEPLINKKTAKSIKQKKKKNIEEE